MVNIFYDLETSDLNYTGQILDYAFVATDENLNVISKLVGKIRLNPTEIPDPQSVLKNRIFISDHLSDKFDTEKVALQKIYDFIENYTDDGVQLIGYNSNKFDLQYLQTSMIRNGIYPYFNKYRVQYKDVIHSIKYLFAKNDFFNNLNDFRLETIAREVFKKDLVQTHNSYDDVCLLIDLCKELVEFPYNFSCICYKAFPETSYIEYSKLLYITNVFYCRELGKYVKDNRKYYHHSSNAGTHLFIDIEKYKEVDDKKKALFYYNENIGQLIINESGNWNSPEDLAIGQAANNYLSNITCETYFAEDRKCDIEQYIYNMKFDEMKLYIKALKNDDYLLLKNSEYKYAPKLYLRYILNNYEMNDSLEEIFQKYFSYKYGGKMILDQYQDHIKYHKTYDEIVNEIDQLLLSDISDDDRKILNDLQNYILPFKKYTMKPIELFNTVA